MTGDRPIVRLAGDPVPVLVRARRPDREHDQNLTLDRDPRLREAAAAAAETEAEAEAGTQIQVAGRRMWIRMAISRRTSKQPDLIADVHQSHHVDAP